MMKSKKKFDCVAFKHSAQMKIYEEIKDQSRDEQIRYFREKAASGEFASWWNKIQPRTDEANTDRA